MATKDVLAAVLPTDAVSSVYARKANILNAAIQEIGMGRYQYHLFVVAGFGWFIDNLWPQTTALILPSVVNEFNEKGAFLVLAQNVGLMLGAAGWGLAADIIGRKWAFNLTLLVAGVFGVVAGASPSFAVVAVMAGLWSIGVGGNLPVDSAVFLEFLPGSHQWLLTIMSVWWALGQIVASAVAWPFMAHYACAVDSPCPKNSNMGWRYFAFTMGGLTLLLFGVRFFTFKLHESPKFLMGRGNDKKAAEVVHKVAAYNRTATTFSETELTTVDDEISEESQSEYTSTVAAVGRSLERFRGGHIKALFKTKKMAWSTSLIILLWFIIGLAFPLYNAFLPFLLTTRFPAETSLSTTYRNYLILGILGIPGSIIGALGVQLPSLGRKGALSISTALTGIFLFAGTTAKSSNQLLGWNSAYALTSNCMYGILYAYTPEVFPTKDRGTGNGLAATANRIGGVIAPIIALYAGVGTSVPVYVAGGGFLVASAVVVLLPFESRGKASL